MQVRPMQEIADYLGEQAELQWSVCLACMGTDAYDVEAGHFRLLVRLHRVALAQVPRSHYSHFTEVICRQPSLL